jgi:Flp pilus assembly protein CpaB
MRRSPRAILAWVATAVVALATLHVVVSDLGALQRQAHALGPNESVVLATRDLSLGTTIGAHDLRVVRRPRATVAADALHDRAAAIGRVVAVPLLHDDVVRAAHLTASNRSSLDGIVAVGNRAVHVVLKDGFRPPVGAVVDVLVSFDPTSISPVGARGRAAVVAAGALVLGLDTDSSSETAPTSGVTLLVPDADAPAVAFAAATGEVTVALAPPENACCTSSP